MAQEASDGQKVFIGGKPAKPSTAVKVGDVVEIFYASSTFKFRIVKIQETVKKEDAASLYEVIV